MSYLELSLPRTLAQDQSDQLRGVLRELATSASQVIQFLNVDPSDTAEPLLFTLCRDLEPYPLLQTVVVDPGGALAPAALATVTRGAPCRIVERTGKTMASRFANPSAAVVFSGTCGESVAVLAHPGNAGFELLWSWGDPNQRVSKLLTLLDQLWNGLPPGEVEPPLAAPHTAYPADPAGVLDPPAPPPCTIPEAAPAVVEDPPLQVISSISRMTIPDDLQLRDYQKDAIRAWTAAKGRGIFAMATGSGKTVTALALASRVAAKNSPLVLVIVCPFLNLCHQWIREISRFGLRAIGCFEDRQRWEAELLEGYQRVSTGLASSLALVTTTATFQRNEFQRHLRRRCETFLHLLVADECHNLGGATIMNCLPEGIHLRLGLSATPERQYDPEGTQAVVDFFGGVVFEYSLSQAIADGRVCPYLYHPHLVELTDEESTEYLDLTSRIGPLLAGKSDDSEVSRSAVRLLIKRARLLANAANKVDILDRLVGALPEPPHKAIFYCGDGSIGAGPEAVRQVRAVARMLGETHGLRVRTFTFRESAQEREKILRDLASGFLNGVVAIRCLDEGIDLPDLRMGFLLASSTNPRQFIQRRGRLLRHAPGKSRAIIHDFIIQPPDLGGSLDDAAFNLERRFFQRELRRISEFCQTAENGPEALGQLRDLRLEYGLIAG